MSERPHSRKRNDSGKSAEARRRGEGLGGGPSGNTGREQSNKEQKSGRDSQNDNSRGLFGSGSSNAFDLNDVMKILKSTGSSQSGTRAGGGFDISDLFNGLQSNNTQVTNNNNIDIGDLINLLQQQQAQGNTTITNNNNISMQDLMSALSNSNNYAGGSSGYTHSSQSGYTHSSQNQQPKPPQAQQPKPQQTQQPKPQQSQVTHSTQTTVPLNSGNKKKGGSGSFLLFLILAAVIIFFVFGRGGCSSGQSSGGVTPAVQPTSTPNSAASTFNFGTATSNASTYVNASSQSVNTTVATQARDKYTTLLGNGNDQVTMLVYMCGTDLESKYAMATADLSEMASAAHSSKINIIVETGGTKTWRNNAVTAGTNQYWRVVDGGLEPLERNLGRKAMTDASTLAEFIKYGVSNYPANRYILVFWDHGGGSVTGYGYDELYPNGSMPVDQIAKALAAGGTKFDIIGFDACLMGNMETAVAIEPYGDYLLASEETEPGTGWYYTDWLTKFAANSSMSSLDIGQSIIDDFCTKRQSGQTSADSNTLSLIDLAEFASTVPSAMNTFAKGISSELNSSNYQHVADARSASREFAASNKLDQIDLIHFCKTLNTSESKALIDALQSCIKYNRTKNITNAYGMSIFFPYRRTQMVNSILNIYNNIDFDKEYSQAVRKFANMAASGQLASSSTSNSLFNLLGGSSVSNGTSYQQLDLSSLLGGSGSYSSYGGLESLLGGGGAADTSILDLFSALYGRAHIESSDLVLSEKNGGQVLSLTPDQWSLIQKVRLNVWVEDDKGYIDLGADNIFEFDEDGDLLMNYDGLWLAVNDQIVPYYMLTDEWTSDSDYKTTGYIPAMLNDEEVHLIVEFSDEFASGRIAGAQKVYETNVEGKLWPIYEGDVIEFICDTYSFDGTFDDRYYFGDPITVEADADGNAILDISDMSVSNDKIHYSYILTDIYGADRYTPFLDY